MTTQLVETLSALLTPTVAIATVLLTYRQYRIARFSAKQSLYSSRRDCYLAAISYVEAIVLYGRVDDGVMQRFRLAVLESRFLLGDKEAALLEEIWGHGSDFCICQRMAETSDPETASSYTRTMRDHQQWMTLAEGRLTKAFQPYLSLVKEERLR